METAAESDAALRIHPSQSCYGERSPTFQPPCRTAECFAARNGVFHPAFPVARVVLEKIEALAKGAQASGLNDLYHRSAAGEVCILGWRLA